MKPSKQAGWKTVGSFALGAAAGSAVALLCAPASGKVTRRRMALKIKSIERQAAQKVLQAKKLLARKAGTLRNSATEKFGDTREWLMERVGNHRHSAPRRIHA